MVKPFNVTFDKRNVDATVFGAKGTIIAVFCDTRGVLQGAYVLPIPHKSDPHVLLEALGVREGLDWIHNQRSLMIETNCLDVVGAIY